MDESTYDDTQDDQTVEELEAENADLERRLAQALRDNERLAAKVDDLKPTVDVSVYLMETADDVRKRFTPQQLKDLANAERIKENRERNARGDFPLPPLEGEELEAAIDGAIEMLLADREMTQPPVEGPLDRTLKMVAPVQKGQQRGHLVQIPYEPQVNNQAGSLADGYERYRQKGFKMTDPTLCPTKDCYRKAAMNDGDFVFGAYCTADHQNRTERDTTQTAVPGVTTRNVLRG